MGAGHLGLRKILKEETNWLEKNTPKHKHTYSEHYLLKEVSPGGKIRYYNIMKCSECLSFKSIPLPGNIQGCIFDELTLEQSKLPQLVGYKRHEHIIGFNDLEKVEYSEKGV